MRDCFCYVEVIYIKECDILNSVSFATIIHSNLEHGAVVIIKNLKPKRY